MTTTQPSALLLEQDPNVLWALEHLLRRRLPEWQLSFMTDPLRALEHIGASRPDVVVSELELSSFGGARFLREVRRRHPSAVRILLTGYASDSEIAEVADLAHQLLVKPMDASTLAPALRYAHRLGAILRDASLREMVAQDNRLPAAPSCFAQLTEVLNGPSPSVDAAASVIEQDAGLAARVVQVSQSALFGARVAPRSVREAIVRLGLELTRGLTLNAHLERLVPRPIAGFDPGAFAQHSLNVAMMMRRLAPATERDEAFLTGIVHGVGTLLMVARRPRHYAALAAEANRRDLPVAQVMDEQLGATEAELGAYLLGLWRFPPRMVAAVGRQHQPRLLVDGGSGAGDVVYLARRLAVDPDAPIEADPPVGATSLDRAFVEAWGGEARLRAWRHVARALCGGGKSPRGAERRRKAG